MAFRNTTGSALMLAALMQALTLAAACGGGDGSKSNATGGSGNEAGADTTPEGGSLNTGGKRSGGGSGTEGGTTSVGGNDVGTTTPAPEFEGVDIEGVPLTPTLGCNGGFDADAKALALTIDEEAHSVLIDATDGNLRANGIVCTTPNGDPVLAADVDHLSITGTAGDDTAVIDLLVGDLGNGLLGSEGAIQLDLGGGYDRLVVRGTRDDDHMACAATSSMPESPLRIDLGSRSHSLKASGIERMVASLGPGNDSFDGAESSLRCNVPLELYGGGDSDILQGGSQNDIINGGDGGDEIQMGASQDGSDVINGGNDGDLVSYSKRSKAVTVTLCSAPSLLGCPEEECNCIPENGESSENDVIVNVEDIDGGAGNDTLVGDENSNVLSGKDGNDTLRGLGGADQLYGDAGDDIIEGGADADLLIGGTGKNSLDGGDGDDICFVRTTDVSKKSCETPVEVL
ncbi:MAG: calcium-binding protein [Polyangiaceae bacterium]